MSNETDTEIAAQTTPEAGDSIFQSQKSQTISTPELNALSASVSSKEAVDPITKAIREEILQKQRDVLRDYFLKPENLAKLDEKIKEDLAKQLENDEKFREFLSNLEKEKDEEKRKLLNAALNTALNDPATKEKFEAVEIAGYKKVHTDFKDSFKTIAWDGPTGEDANKNTTQSQKITNDVDGEICTLTETTHATKPISVTKSDGTEVKVNSYRTIDFPVKLNGAPGNMHLSIVALDENGNRPPIDKAVYFTAHYEEGPNGKPLLKEISSPMPIKFIGDGKDAIGYVEHGGKIYTMPVTRGKYEEMMQEVVANKGHGVDLSQTVQEIANDKVMNMSQEQGDKSIVDGYKAISEKYADLQKNPEGKLPEELSKEELKDKKAFIKDLSNNNNSLSDKDKVVILEELIKYETNRGEKVIGDGKIAINETLEMLNTEKGILKERIVEQDKAKLTKEKETVEHFSELPSHGLTAEEMQKEASENKEKETAKLFSELPFHDREELDAKLKTVSTPYYTSDSKNLQQVEAQTAQPIQQNKGSEVVESTVALNPIENKAEIEQVSPPSPPPIPPRPDKPLESEGKAEHDDKQAPIQSETKSELAVPTQISSSHPVESLSSKISQPLDAKAETVSSHTSDSKNLQQVEEQAAQLMANLGGSSSSRSTEGESTKQKLHAAAKAVIDEAEKLVDQMPDSKVKADNIKNILSSSAPIYPKEDQKKQIIDEYNKQNTIDEKKYFIEDKIVSNKDLSKEERLGIIDKLIILEVNERYSKVENAEVTTARNPTAGQVKTPTEQTELQKVQNQQGEKAIRQTQVETVNTPNNVGIITGLNEAKIKINSEDQSLSKSAITKQGHIR
ncbi:Sca4 family spreading effector [Rickettsia endosymbiont of Polydrusus tereticollis]|uniref:Sca4 family spreading effector n=1 Tax=Rickettsia endosymbiont of Polydrusus tereticollis TaxID=3066251 RepID=UPI003132BA4A